MVRKTTNKVEEITRVFASPPWKHSEDLILEEFQKYLASCYNPDEHHYANVGTDVQAIDVWAANGSAVATSRDTAIKYLMRYGKKDGKNKKDLLKAMHYIVFMLHYDGHYTK